MSEDASCITVEEPLRTISRQALYRRVWDTPISHVAKEFGLSDRGLTKICLRHDIPVPPRGYWAKKQAGHRVPVIPLPEAINPFAETIHLPASAQRPAELEALLTKQQEERRAEAPMDEELVVPAVSPHASLKAAVRKLAKQKAAFVEAGQLRGEKACSIGVSREQSARLVAVLDRIARIGEARGIAFEFTEETARAASGTQSIKIEAGELYRSVPHTLTAKEQVAMDKWRASVEKRAKFPHSLDGFIFRPALPEYDQAYSGRLFFRIDNYESSLRRSWQDGSVQRLETLCTGIIGTLEAHFLAERLRVEKADRDARAREILQHRRQLSEQRRTREANRSAFLGTAMEQAAEAARIREFLNLHDGQPAGPELERLLAWARTRLDNMSHALSPTGLAEELGRTALFPEPDPLHDPQGEPPAPPPWVP